MNTQPKSVSSQSTAASSPVTESIVPADTLGSLSACLVEGDPVQLQRERKIRRRALFISITLQILFVAGLVLFPLLSKGERITLKNYSPLPPFPSRGAEHSHAGPSQPRQRPCVTCFHNPSTPIVVTHRDDSGSDDPTSTDPGIPGGPKGSENGIPFSNSDPGPTPLEEREPRKDPVRLHLSQIQPAMLAYRVEPIYPPLAYQMRREGHVELRAVIATDGSIQFLEAVSGDPVFYQSAMTAVRQWRYHPTILNGQAVEVDTHIVVNYSLGH